MRRVGVHAATDVTGYGLVGHLGEMIRAAGVSARLVAGAVPLLPGVRELAAAGVVAGGTKRNLASALRFTAFSGVEEPDRLVLTDAQTSGGLLIAVDRPLEAALHQALREEGVAAATVGEVLARRFEDGPAGRIEVVTA